MKAAIYARVSTEKQDYALQLTELRSYAQRMGWEIVEYLEKESSVKERPVFDQLLSDARMRRFDVVMVWKIDRLARSMKQFLDSVLELDRFGVRFLAITQSIDTDKQNPMARFFMHILAAFAEMERSMIVERSQAGLAEYKRAYKAGEVGRTRHSKSGKDLAPVRPKKVFRRDEARRLRAKGLSWREISHSLGVARSTIRDEVRGVRKVGKSSAESGIENTKQTRR